MSAASPALIRSMQHYLERSGHPGPMLSEKPLPDLGLVIVIPSFKETGLLLTLESLWKQSDIPVATEVLTVINYPEAQRGIHGGQAMLQKKQTEEWMAGHRRDGLSFHCLPVLEMEGRHAGVGFARKAGMDEAVRRLASAGNPSGIIVCLDADCLVHPGYLKHIYSYYLQKDAKACVSIGFAHQIPDDPALREAIGQYESHLRYYIAAQRAVGYPFAFQTLGSCMAVRAHDYCAQGGMNRRQAGEDFYFMHKFSVIGELGEIAEALVFPSARISDRVPFGTGKAIRDFVDSGQRLTYSFEAISLWGKVISLIPDMRSWNENSKEKLACLHPAVSDFFNDKHLDGVIAACRHHSASDEAFLKRMMRWFDPFLLMKFLHFLRDRGFPDEATDLAWSKLNAGYDFL